MNCFLQCRRQHFMSLSFFAEKVILELKCTKSLLRASKNTWDRFHEFELFAEKVILELKCTNHFFRASKNTNSVFSATKQIMRMWSHRCSKASFSVRKVTKCNFKSKAQHEKVSF